VAGRCPRVVSVLAYGTGCPTGTTSTAISRDGSTFTTTFSNFEASVNRNTSVSVKACQLVIKLKSPRDISYTIREFYSEGYAYLEQGMKGREIARSYFPGTPIAGVREVRRDLTGPFDDTFIMQDTIGCMMNISCSVVSPATMGHASHRPSPRLALESQRA
jgi:hypothetical protein